MCICSLPSHLISKRRRENSPNLEPSLFSAFRIVRFLSDLLRHPTTEPMFHVKSLQILAGDFEIRQWQGKRLQMVAHLDGRRGRMIRIHDDGRPTRSQISVVPAMMVEIESIRVENGIILCIHRIFIVTDWMTRFTSPNDKGMSRVLGFFVCKLSSQQTSHRIKIFYPHNKSHECSFNFLLQVAGAAI